MKQSLIGARVCFFVPERAALTDAVFASQVLAPARQIQAMGAKCLVIGSESSSERATAACSMLARDYRLISSISPRKHTGLGVIGLWRTASAAYKYSKVEISEFDPTHVYVRSFVAENSARGWANRSQFKLIYDCRGAVSQEVRPRGKLGAVYGGLISHLEVTSLRKADRISCVSNNLRAHVSGFIVNRHITVIPCCVDQGQFKFDALERTKIRKKIGFEDGDIVIAYAGGLSHWQRVRDIADYMGTIAATDRRFKFAVFTPNQQEAYKIFSNVPGLRERLHIESVAHTDMSSRLSACDVGIIMRHDTLMNHVASPIKVAEYLSCGLFVLLTLGVGDYSSALPENGLGYRIDDERAAAGEIGKSLANLDFSRIRNVASEFVFERLSWQAYESEFVALYS